jgi:hypothetical protein
MRFPLLYLNTTNVLYIALRRPVVSSSNRNSKECPKGENIHISIYYDKANKMHNASHPDDFLVNIISG